MAAFAFARIADEMVEGETHAFDRAVLTALRDPADLSRPIGPAWLKTAAIDLTSLGSLAVLGLIVLMVAGLYAALRRWRDGAIILIAAGGGLMLSNALKLLFGRQRPDAVFQAVPAINASFPSGHAMLSAVVFLTLGASVARITERRRVRAYALTCAVLITLVVGLSRVYLGVHWPTDVLAGWCLGAAWACLCWLAEWIFDRRSAG
jgi:undecaprenyl-diphosphatase